jgi:ribosomal protein S18 acetylase RimI-like enzyme
MESLIVRKYTCQDEKAVIQLWKDCKLLVPQNNPKIDIEEKMNFQPDLFFVGTVNEKIIASIMVGYDGHRGWINYLAVHPLYQRKGFGTQLMNIAREKLLNLGCQKINVQVRNTNLSIVKFYKSNGFMDDDVIGLGKRIKKN